MLFVGLVLVTGIQTSSMVETEMQSWGDMKVVTLDSVPSLLAKLGAQHLLPSTVAFIGMVKT